MTAIQPRTIMVRVADRECRSLREACGRSARHIANARDIANARAIASAREIARARERKSAGTFIVVSAGMVASEIRTAALGELQGLTITSQKIAVGLCSSRPAELVRYRMIGGSSLRTDLHRPPAIAEAFDPNLALAPVTTGRELRIGSRRRPICGR